MARLLLLQDQTLVSEMLVRIQNDLFDLGADLCVPDTDEPLPYTPLRLKDGQVGRLEREIDLMNKEMAPLASFILPGGSQASAALHLARTICRRAERSHRGAEARAQGERVSDPVALTSIGFPITFLSQAGMLTGKVRLIYYGIPGQNA